MEREIGVQERKTCWDETRKAGGVGSLGTLMNSYTHTREHSYVKSMFTHTAEHTRTQTNIHTDIHTYIEPSHTHLLGTDTNWKINGAHR